MWATAGVGLFGSGFAVTFAVVTGTHPLLAIIPGALALGGVYLFVAALTPSRWFMYPGKRKAILRQRQNSGVAEVLGLYLSVGITLGRNDPDNHAYSDEVAQLFRRS